VSNLRGRTSYSHALPRHDGGCCRVPVEELCPPSPPTSAWSCRWLGAEALTSVSSSSAHQPGRLVTVWGDAFHPRHPSGTVRGFAVWNPSDTAWSPQGTARRDRIGKCLHVSEPQPRGTASGLWAEFCCVFSSASTSLFLFHVNLKECLLSILSIFYQKGHH